LEDHLRKFPACSFATLATLKLADLNSADQPAAPLPPPVAVPSRQAGSPGAAPLSLPAVVLDDRSPSSTALPPVEVPAPSYPAPRYTARSGWGDRYQLNAGEFYEVRPQLDVTTSYDVEDGVVTVYKDGQLQFTTSGTFRLWTRGFSRFHVIAVDG